jgi:hypothetical protein
VVEKHEKFPRLHRSHGQRDRSCREGGLR